MIDRTDITIAGKIALFVLTLSASLFILVAGTKSALSASVKDISIIKGDVITAGDLFDGMKHNADYVIGAAPQPGKDIVLNARTLYRIASALDIDWRPQSTAQQVIIRRSATVIPASLIEAKIDEELRASGAKGDFTLAFNSDLENIVLPDATDATFEVSDLRYDPQKDYFEASIVAPSRDNPLKRFNVAGEVEKFASLPVLKTTVNNGTIISLGDIDFVDVPVKNLAKDTVLDADKIAGKTPRRLIASGKPIGFNDLQMPQLVGRGESVTLIFKNGPMIVSTKGKSLQNGAMGDMVQVTNVSSSKNVAGVVTGSREITVQ